ncbi:hypothetical protein FZ103_16180 [Streptomonospora sp. PA3]|uniref:hypothetical protein n=1 Tax=Streptomonospora sp. PA3 TaxID=2607326 RepID=UPI0012DE2FFF|nr:hypothetical protein [Streptomonospora sp. PA3]MUL42687.1 hypothetical protein [Streptomonospora sp. PA3]
MGYIEKLSHLLGVNPASWSYAWGAIEEAVGAVPSGYKTIVENFGGLDLDGGFFRVGTPEFLNAIGRSGSPEIIDSMRMVEVCDGYGVALEECGSGEYIDHFRLVDWAGSEAGNFAFHWECLKSEYRVVATDYHEYYVYSMEPDEFLFKLLNREIECPPLNDEGWPGETFDVEFF